MGGKAARGIKACFVLIRMDRHLEAVSADVLALNQAVQAILLWSDRAFADRSALGEVDGHVILRPEIGDVIRAAYDRTLPVTAQDASHAMRLFARLPRPV